MIGVSASGMTQFVRGAFTRARKAGTRIIFVTCDPAIRVHPGAFLISETRAIGRAGSVMFQAISNMWSSRCIPDWA